MMMTLPIDLSTKLKEILDDDFPSEKVFSFSYKPAQKIFVNSTMSNKYLQYRRRMK